MSLLRDKLSPPEIEQRCDEFEAAWRAERPPRIEDYCAVEEAKLIKQILIAQEVLQTTRHPLVKTHPFLL